MALAAACAGIALGAGTDVAMNRSQVTLVGGYLRDVATARELSQASIANIKQNPGSTFVYHSFGVPLAAGLFFPCFSPLQAGCCHP